MNKKTLIFIVGDFIFIILFFARFIGFVSWIDVAFFVYATIYLLWRLFTSQENANRWQEFIACMVLIMFWIIISGGQPFVSLWP